MATLERIIQPFDADTSGFDRGTRRVEDQLRATAREAEQFRGRFAKAWEGFNREQQALARGVMSVQTSIGGAHRSVASYEQANLRLSQAVKRNVITQTEADTLLKRYQQTLDQTSQAQHRYTRAVEQTGRAQAIVHRRGARGVYGPGGIAAPHGIVQQTGILAAGAIGGRLGTPFGLGGTLAGAQAARAAATGIGLLPVLGGAGFATGLGFSAFQGERRQLEEARLAALGAPGIRPELVDLGLEVGDLQGTIEAYTRLTLAREELGVSAQELVKFEADLLEAIRISGTGARQASAGIFQFTQALASGQFQGDEFRSVMENIPIVAQAIGRGLVEMGVAVNGTVGELRALSQAGELTGTRAFKAFQIGFSQLRETAEDVPLPMRNSLRSIVDAFKEANAAFGDESGLTDWVRDSLQSLAELARESIPLMAQAGRLAGEAFSYGLDAVGISDSLEELNVKIAVAREEFERQLDIAIQSRVEDIDATALLSSYNKLESLTEDLKKKMIIEPVISTEHFNLQSFMQDADSLLGAIDKIKDERDELGDTTKSNFELRGNVRMDPLDTEPTRTAAQARFSASPLIVGVDVDDIPTPRKPSIDPLRVDTLVEPAAAPQVSDPAPIVINQVMGPAPPIDYPETRQINVPVGIDQPRESIQVPEPPEIQIASVLPDVATMRRAFERLTEVLQSYLPDLSIGSSIEDPGRPTLPIVEPLQVEIIRPEIPVPVEPTMPRLRAPVDVDRITPPQAPLLSPLNVPIERPTVPTPVTPELLPLRQDVVTERAPAPVQPFVDEMEIPVETPRIPTPDLPEDLPTIIVPVETEVAPLPVIPPLPTLELLTDIPLPSRADVAQWVRNVQALLEPLRIETETEPAEPPELPAVDELRVPIERPIVPRPDAPAMSPLRVPTTTAPAPAPELPYLPGMDIPVRRPRVPEPQYPTLNRLMVPTDTERAPQPQLPLIPRLQVETDIGAVPDIELPDVPTLIIPVELADIPLPEPPEIEALEVPVDRPVIPEPIKPVIPPLQVRTETEAAPQPRLPIVRAIEVPTTTQPAPDVELPEVDPLTVEVLTEDAQPPRMPVVDALRVDTITAPAPVPDLPPALPVIQIETATDPVLPPALPAAPTLRVRVERPVVPEIELPDIPALLVDVLTEDAPEPRLPELDPLVVPVAQPVAPDVLLPTIPEISVPTRTERAPRPVLPDIEPLVIGASIQPDPVPAPGLPEIPPIVIRSYITPPENVILPEPDNLIVASMLGLPTLADVERWWADLKTMIPILGVETETEPAPEPEYPQLDTLVVPVETEDAPEPEVPDAATLLVRTETEPADSPILPREGVFLKAGIELPDLQDVVNTTLKWWGALTSSPPVSAGIVLKPEVVLPTLAEDAIGPGKSIVVPADIDTKGISEQLDEFGGNKEFLPRVRLEAAVGGLEKAEDTLDDVAKSLGFTKEETIEWGKISIGAARDAVESVTAWSDAVATLAGEYALATGNVVNLYEASERAARAERIALKAHRPVGLSEFQQQRFGAFAATKFTGLGPNFPAGGPPSATSESLIAMYLRQQAVLRGLKRPADGEVDKEEEARIERLRRIPARAPRPIGGPGVLDIVQQFEKLQRTSTLVPSAQLGATSVEDLREALGLDEETVDLAEQLATSLDDVTQAARGAGASLQDGMIAFALEGENALDVLNRIGEQLAEIALRTATTGLFDRVLPALVGGAFSNLFPSAPGVAEGGGGTPGPEVSKAPTGETLFYTVKRGGFERGGPVQARQSALVGEKRPELFIPGLTTDQLTPRKLGNQPELVGEHGPELVQATQSGTILPLTQIRPDSILFRQSGGSLPATSRALVGEALDPELFLPHGGGSSRAQATMASAAPVEVKVIDQRSGNPPAITPQVRTGSGGQRFVEVLVTDGLSSASRSGRLDPMMGQYGVRRTGVIR